jgi:hypothetical protein
MNRRDLLKMLGTLPVAGLLQGCTPKEPISAPASSTDAKAHTLQILLEGAFAVVLQKQSQRLIAFVPQADPGRKDLEHYFCFNDPEKPIEPQEKSRGFRFELSGDGLHTYSSPDNRASGEIYTNPGFNDFSAEVKSWILPPSIAILDLPMPRSINFSGRPLTVHFDKHALKPIGIMPTNYILEYRVADAGKVKLKCDQPTVDCAPSLHCPPGVLRFFFGAGPLTHDPNERQQHAVDFFNFILDKSFPELREKYRLAAIEQSDYEQPDVNVRLRPASFGENSKGNAGAFPPAKHPPNDRARLVPVASLVDCQIGGILVGTKSAPIK